MRSTVSSCERNERGVSPGYRAASVRADVGLIIIHQFWDKICCRATINVRRAAIGLGPTRIRLAVLHDARSPACLRCAPNDIR